MEQAAGDRGGVAHARTAAAAATGGGDVLQGRTHHGSGKKETYNLKASTRKRKYEQGFSRLLP